MIKTMELGKIRNGELFTQDGIEFVKLGDDHGASFVLMAGTLPDYCAFDTRESDGNEHNNYIGSNVQRVVDNWLREHPSIHKATVERPIDLTSMDGMTDYGLPCVYGRILTSDEYRKYRRFIPLTDECYWLATPWCTPSSPSSSNGDYAYFVHTDGAQRRYYTYYAYYCARPALYLESSLLVSVETDDEEKALRDYTDTELLDELLRRRVSPMEDGYGAKKN